ncbi:hypothetical protein AAL05_20960 [Salmonella enterica subsp. enterica serovar Typhimurium]|nr:hypothetical protein [Salmonella enterica subsp. enterica serovar Typhimurium]EBW5280579.1 hypothetical protein [Salmonella enterica subsp. enterica serovar Typhimurium]EEN7779203.1 hypothetical protein [Salmonella enterica subsp. enterica serovar Typhimurium]EFN6543445.1 hypothetical protein [Salmonella enterica subsp. enterica serovar Typhimurium]
MSDIKPVIKAYSELQQDYDWFNLSLFDKALPDLLITLQLGRNTFGYFAAEHFTRESSVSELAMNPDYFGGRSLAVTDENDTDLINRLSLTVSKSRPELIPDDDDLSVMIKPPVKGTGTRMKFSCPECWLNAWAKSFAVLLCGECRCELTAAE